MNNEIHSGDIHDMTDALHKERRQGMNYIDPKELMVGDQVCRTGYGLAEVVSVNPTDILVRLIPSDTVMTWAHSIEPVRVRSKDMAEEIRTVYDCGRRTMLEEMKEKALRVRGGRLRGGDLESTLVLVIDKSKNLDVLKGINLGEVFEVAVLKEGDNE